MRGLAPGSLALGYSLYNPLRFLLVAVWADKMGTSCSELEEVAWTYGGKTSGQEGCGGESKHAGFGEPLVETQILIAWYLQMLFYKGSSSDYSFMLEGKRLYYP